MNSSFSTSMYINFLNFVYVWKIIFCSSCNCKYWLCRFIFFYDEWNFLPPGYWNITLSDKVVGLSSPYVDNLALIELYYKCIVNHWPNIKRWQISTVLLITRCSTSRYTTSYPSDFKLIRIYIYIFDFSEWRFFLLMLPSIVIYASLKKLNFTSKVLFQYNLIWVLLG